MLLQPHTTPLISVISKNNIYIKISITKWELEICMTLSSSRVFVLSISHVEILWCHSPNFINKNVFLYFIYFDMLFLLNCNLLQIKLLLRCLHFVGKRHIFRYDDNKKNSSFCAQKINIIVLNK